MEPTSPAPGAKQAAVASPALGEKQAAVASPVPAPGAMQAVGASSPRRRDPRLLGRVSFDIPSWGLRKPMGFCKDLNVLAAAVEPSPNGSSQSPPKRVPAQQADEGAAAAQESPRPPYYMLRDRRTGRESGEDARENKNGGGSFRFSRQLTSQEIEEDFIAMTGKKPPRRVKRIHKSVQRQTEPFSPGNSLAGVSHERYKVKEVKEKRGF